MNTRKHPRTLAEAFPTEADRTGIHHDDDDAPRAWPFVWIIISIALLIAALVAFGGPSAQQEAEATAASVQDAETAALQVHVDAACGRLAGRAGMQCALDELQRIQPERWIHEDAARAALAVPYAINEE